MVIDLRSDTVTLPTPAMREAMAKAEVGDDGYGEDPTTNKLEAIAAAMTGKEAALFTSSGTMSNLISIMTHCHRGDEVIVGSEAHVFFNEVASASGVAGVQLRTVANNWRGMMDPQAVEEAIRDDNIHFPKTSLIAIENTHNRCGGTVLSSEDMAAIAYVAARHEISVYLDGARIFNASVALGVDVKELTRHGDALAFCLSKGLSAPVGSLLCGTRDFIRKARKNRQMLGGGMRQAGVLAAAGIVALETMIGRLKDDHATAKRLVLGLQEVYGLGVEPERVQTNIVLVRVLHGDAREFAQHIAQAGVKANWIGGDNIRLVTHYGITPEHIDEAIDIIASVQSKKARR